MTEQVNALSHWTTEEDEHQILWLTLDQKDAQVNTLNTPVMQELERIIDEIASKPLKGMVIRSAKKSGFIAGADISEMENIKTVEEATEKVIIGQDIFKKLGQLPFPTLSLISGFCLGGGLELALWCDYRIAEDIPSTRLGLPEVMLGLNPGWGGTTILPRLIGAPAAMNLILNGHSVSAQSARKLGFIDDAVPSRHLNNAAVKTILTKPKKAQPGFFAKHSNAKLLRPWLARVMRKKVAQKVQQIHYPAPYAIVDTWEKYGIEGDTALTESAKVFGRLLETDTGKNLSRVFFLQERLKGLSRKVDFKAKHVHVVGAGVMGGDIAAWCALKGLTVTLQDREPKFIAPAIARAHELFKRKLKKPRPIQEAMDRLVPDVNGLGIAQADVIIEAIFENLEAKQALFKDAEIKAKPDAILATNTSSIMLDKIADALQKPERLVGIHFFNPVAKMPLVEVVHDDKSDETVVKHALAFVKHISRLPLPAKSRPCFLVNRVLAPYLAEAAMLLEEGVPAVAIDKAAENFGMPMGPIELVDNVGLDVCVAVAKKYTDAFGGAFPNSIDEKVKNGELGKKTGRGFYQYKNGKAIKPRLDGNTPVPDDITDRLVMRILNEAVACLREGIVTDKDLVDAGMIFGTGFAPFRGGPMHYIQQSGLESILERLSKLEKAHGERFKADDGWQSLDISGEAKSNSKKNNVTRLQVA